MPDARVWVTRAETRTRSLFVFGLRLVSSLQQLILYLFIQVFFRITNKLIVEKHPNLTHKKDTFSLIWVFIAVDEMFL